MNTAAHTGGHGDYDAMGIHIAAYIYGDDDDDVVSVAAYIFGDDDDDVLYFIEWPPHYHTLHCRQSELIHGSRNASV